MNGVNGTLGIQVATKKKPTAYAGVSDFYATNMEGKCSLAKFLFTPKEIM